MNLKTNRKTNKRKYQKKKQTKHTCCHHLFSSFAHGNLFYLVLYYHRHPYQSDRNKCFFDFFPPHILSFRIAFIRFYFVVFVTISQRFKT